MQKIALIITCFFLFSACNGNAVKKTSEISKLESLKEESPQLIIDLSFKTSKPDVFKIMMNNIEFDELQKKNIQIFENVIPSTADDNIVAKFDPGNFSKQVVIHLGNKTEKEVVINKLLISFGDNQFNLTNAEDFNQYLAFNKFIERDSLTNKMITKRISGKLNPTIRIKNILLNQLMKE